MGNGWVRTGYRLLGGMIILLACALSIVRYFPATFLPASARMHTFVQEKIPYPFKFEEAKVILKGFTPVIELQGVEIGPLNDHTLLKAERVQLYVNVLRLFTKQLQFTKLVLERAHLRWHSVGEPTAFDLSYLNNGLPWDLNASPFGVKEVIIESSVLEWVHQGTAHALSVPLACFSVGSLTKKSPNAFFLLEDLELGTLLEPLPSFFRSLLPSSDELKKIEKTTLRSWVVWDEKQAPNVSFELDMQSDDGKHSILLQKRHTQVWEIMGKEIPAVWMQNLVSRLPQFTAFKNFAMRGQIDYLALSLKEQGDNLLPVQFSMLFSDIDLSEEKLKLTGLSGAAVLKGNRGWLALEDREGVWRHAALSEKTLAIAYLDTELSFHLNNAYHLESIFAKHFSVHLEQVPISGRFVFQFKEENPYPFAQMWLECGSASLENMLSLLPSAKLEPKLNVWVKKALQGGEVTAANMVLHGDLTRFPFDQNEGVFELAMELKEVQLQYDPDWPTLSRLGAALLFHNASLSIAAQSAQIEGGGQLLDARAVIPFLRDPILTVDTEVVSTLEGGVQVVRQTPLKQSVGRFFEPLSLSGPMQLSLGLIVPLGKYTVEPIKVKGVIEVHDAKLGVPTYNTSVEKVKGKLSFTQENIFSNDLQGVFLDFPTHFELAGQFKETPEIHIQATGHADLNTVATFLVTKVPPFIKGETDYHAQLALFPLSENKGSLKLSSNLRGVEVNLPAPFEKSSSAKRESALSLYFEPHNLMRLFFQYGEHTSMASTFHIEDEKAFILKGAHIYVGEKKRAQFKETGVLRIEGEVDALDLAIWEPYLGGTSHSVLSPALSLRVKHLNLLGAQFSHIKFEAKEEKSTGSWKLDFQGPSLQGEGWIPSNNKETIRLHFQTVTLNDHEVFQDIFSQKEATPLKLEHTVDLKVHHLKLNKKIFQDLEAQWHPTENGIALTKLNARVKQTTFSLKGQWDVVRNQVRVQGRGKTQNISAFFDALGIKHALAKAKGEAQFAFQWHGKPWKIDKPSLKGKASLHLKQGFINGVKPGLGRVLSVLNIDNMQRRLNLEFSDLTRNSIAFDALTGSFQFAQGAVSTNDVILQGPSAKIVMVGRAELSTEKVFGHITVMPNVTGSLPIAAAIAAGNPAVGAAVWVADKVLGKKLQEIHRYRYRVSGTWGAPVVDSLSANE